MDLSVAPPTRRATAGQTPPAKRYHQTVTNEKEQELVDTMNDHATRLDKLQRIVKDLVSTSAAAFQTIDEKDKDLKDRLQALEAALQTFEARVTTTAQDVVTNDSSLKENLKVLEQQLHATAETARATSQAAGSPEGDVVAVAALAARMELAEQYISKVEHMTREVAKEHQSNGQQMFNNMTNGMEHLRGRLQLLENNFSAPAGAPTGAPAAAQSGASQGYGNAAPAAAQSGAPQ